MAVQEVTAFQFDCDACGNTQVVAQPTDYTGYTGSVQNGGVDADWVADKAGCINKAIRTALERATDTRKPTPSATLILADDVCRASGTTAHAADIINENQVLCPLCSRTVALTGTHKIRKHTRPAASAA